MSVRFLNFDQYLEKVSENFVVGAEVSAVLSCENAKQVQGGTVRGKR